MITTLKSLEILVELCHELWHRWRVKLEKTLVSKPSRSLDNIGMKVKHILSSGCRRLSKKGHHLRKTGWSYTCFRKRIDMWCPLKISSSFEISWIAFWILTNSRQQSQHSSRKQWPNLVEMTNLLIFASLTLKSWYPSLFQTTPDSWLMKNILIVDSQDSWTHKNIL